LCVEYRPQNIEGKSVIKNYKLGVHTSKHWTPGLVDCGKKNDFISFSHHEKSTRFRNWNARANRSRFGYTMLIRMFLVILLVESTQYLHASEI